MDGHSSRYAAFALEQLRANHIHVYILPSHTSHVLQPVDRMTFGVMKGSVRSSLTSLLNKAPLITPGCSKAMTTRCRVLQAACRYEN